jgi:hypothetical protein
VVQRHPFRHTYSLPHGYTIIDFIKHPYGEVFGGNQGQSEAPSLSQIDPEEVKYGGEMKLLRDLLRGTTPQTAPALLHLQWAPLLITTQDPSLSSTMKEREQEGKKEREKEGKKEREKEGKKEREQEGKKERKAVKEKRKW